MSKRKRETSFSASSINERSAADPSIVAARRTSGSNEPVPSIEEFVRATAVSDSYLESPFSQVPRPSAIHADASTPRTPFPNPRIRPQGAQNIEPGLHSSPPHDSGIVIDDTDTQEAEAINVDNDEEENESVVEVGKVKHQSANDEAIDAARKAIRKGRNVFVTGPAGSGKSYFIHKLVESLRGEEDGKEDQSKQNTGKETEAEVDQGPQGQSKDNDAAKVDKGEKKRKTKRVEVIAPTGTAALNVGGKTCHSFFGLTPNTTKLPLASLLEVAETAAIQQRLQDIDVLVIDEISMVSNEFLQQMDLLMRRARHLAKIKEQALKDKKKGNGQGTDTGRQQGNGRGGNESQEQGDAEDDSQNVNNAKSKDRGKGKKKGHKKKRTKGIEDRPFGGVTVVAIGDFAQLAPVLGLSHCMECGEERTATRRGTVLSCFRHGPKNDDEKWAFMAPTWKQLKFKNILLEHIMRQHNDDFREIVYSMWLGNKLTAPQLALLKEDRPLPNVTTHLFTRRINAENHNTANFNRLDAPTARYVALDRFNQHPAHDHTWIPSLGKPDIDSNFLVALKDHRYVPRLQLKLGMPVILLHNIDVRAGLVNGSQGKIIGFTTGDQLDYMHLAVTGSSDPLGYSWHDTEGRVTNDYVPSLRGTYAAMRDDEIKRFINDAANRGQKWPVVEFNNGIVRPIIAECCVQEVRYMGRASLLSRTQVPLMAGWALTIHKAQGMTMDAVVVDVAGAFDPGQEYVAISRARTLQGLEIKGLQPNGLKYRTPDVVRKFMKTTFPELKQRFLG